MASGSAISKAELLEPQPRQSELTCFAFTSAFAASKVSTTWRFKGRWSASQFRKALCNADFRLCDPHTPSGSCTNAALAPAANNADTRSKSSSPAASINARSISSCAFSVAETTALKHNFGPPASNSLNLSVGCNTSSPSTRSYFRPGSKAGKRSATSATLQDSSAGIASKRGSPDNPVTHTTRETSPSAPDMSAGPPKARAPGEMAVQA
mmetsp:Transcript_6861/g.19563  ORF Transcript_6861/g.19563 Transcript_6861/m.19563 type:complete len:210 (+) Transcript_6861:918-1547(+)